MINKKSTSAAPNSSYSNFLSNAVTIKGTYRSEQDAIIAGTIEGDVHVKGLLKLEQNGVLKGKLFATNADIAGKIDGEVRCEAKAILRKTAEIKADLHAKSLQVEADAVIDGQIHMSRDVLETKKK
jgi:cytoskeletal protein CcmA (bactofilin family)